MLKHDSFAIECWKLIQHWLELCTISDNSLPRTDRLFHRSTYNLFIKYFASNGLFPHGHLHMKINFMQDKAWWLVLQKQRRYEIFCFETMYRRFNIGGKTTVLSEQKSHSSAETTEYTKFKIYMTQQCLCRVAWISLKRQAKATFFRKYKYEWCDGAPSIVDLPNVA